MDTTLLSKPHTSLNEEDLIQLVKISENDEQLQHELILYLLRKWFEANPILLREKALQAHALKPLSKILTETSKALDHSLFDAWRNLICFTEKQTPPLHVRKKLAQDLLTQKKRIQLRDYMAALNHTLSRRQALRDLETFSFVRAEGSTKARRYSLIKSRDGQVP